MPLSTYHVTQYKHSKPGLASIASWQIRNLTRYLYLELPHQQLPLLIELEEHEFMHDYLQSDKRKPFFCLSESAGVWIGNDASGRVEPHQLFRLVWNNKVVRNNLASTVNLRCTVVGWAYDQVIQFGGRQAARRAVRMMLWWDRVSIRIFGHFRPPAWSRARYRACSHELWCKACRVKN